MDHKVMAVDGQLLDIKQVPRLLNCSAWTMRLWESDGRIRAVRLGRLLRFTLEDVQAFIEESRTPRDDARKIKGARGSHVHAGAH